MSRYEEVVEKLVAFRHARDWEQFHTPKNLSMGIAIEASELMQEFLWKNDDEVAWHIKDKPEKVNDEIADIASYIFLLSQVLCVTCGSVDIISFLQSSIRKNTEK